MVIGLFKFDVIPIKNGCELVLSIIGLILAQIKK